jgi:WD40 repeat protein
MKKRLNRQVRILIIGFLLAFGIALQSDAQNPKGIGKIVVSPDGQFVGGAGSRGLLYIWETATGNLVYDFQSEIGNVLVGDLSWNPASTPG